MKWANLLAVCSVTAMLASFVPGPGVPAAHAAGSYNYAEALQKSIWFYDAQRSGDLPADNRVNWRGDSALADGSDVGHDLTGGWFDAGDHVKFGLPMAASATMLAWSAVEYRDAYEKTGQLKPLMDNLRWADDYFVKAHTAPNELYGQVGNGGIDHAYWGPPETMQVSRPAYKIDASCPGSDLAGETAAALAASSIVFRSSDSAYADKLLTHAKQLFSFADKYRGKYSDCIKDAQGYYQSFSGYADELTWMAVWLYLATNDQTYLTYAEDSTSAWGKEDQGTSPYWSYKWGQAWDDKHYGAQLLLAKLTGKPAYTQSTERSLDFWTNGVAETGERIKYTPGGQAWLDQWGSNRYAANTSFLAFVYADWLQSKDAAKAAKYRTFAENQINYILGDNPQHISYEIGLGSKYPLNPHHRGAHSSWEGMITTPAQNRHILYGALVGGPGSDDSYSDARDNYVNNEVATDYNAGFTGALAKMYLLHGGTVDPSFPSAEKPSSDEFFVEARVNVSGTNTYQIEGQLNNRSGWPARASDKLSFRFFVDISELLNAGYSPSAVTTSVDASSGAKISSLTQWSGSIYYTTVDFSGTKLYPGDMNKFRRSAYFNISVPTGAPWNPANDPSYKGLTGSVAKTSAIPVYEAGVKVFGSEPSGGNEPPAVPAAPSGLKAAAGNAQVALSWSASTGATGYSVKRSTASGGPYTVIAPNVTAAGYTDTAVVNGTTYYYVVSAFNTAGEGADSLSVSATPAAVVVLPGSFTLTASADTSKITLGWTASANALSYNVLRGTAAAGPFTALASGLTATAYTDTSAAAGTSYYYLVTAVNAAGATDSNTVSAKLETGTGTPASLVVQYKAADSSAIDNQIKPHLQIVNKGTAPVALSGLKLRYYYTIDGEKAQTFSCDYAAVGCANLSGTFSKLPAAKTGADYYLEIAFRTSAGSLAPGSSTGEMQIRVNKSDWTNYNEANDYSYDATKTAFADWSKVTLYQDGVLVWGAEP